MYCAIESCSHGRTPLHYAYYEQKFETASAILSRGAEMNAKDNLGCSALHEVRMSLYVTVCHSSNSNVDLIVDELF